MFTTSPVRLARVLILSLLLPVAWPPPATAQVAFISDRDSTLDIYILDSAGAAPRRITRSPEADYGLVWSPDGASLSYVVYGRGDQNIWRIKPDGSGAERVTSGPYSRNINDLSPDGKRMLISSKKESAKGDAYLADLADGSERRITDNDFFEAGASFSPDGKSIAISIQIAPDQDPKKTGNAEIFLIDTAGTELRRLTNSDSTFDALPAFSPDGKKLAYHSCVGGECAIRVLDLATGASAVVSEKGIDSRWPRWSPDGRWIAYTRSMKGNTDIWIVKPDGSGNRAFIVSPGRDEIATFGPKPFALPD